MPIKNRLAETHAEITGWRRHLHAHPELDFDVHETAAFVVDRLREFGVDGITTGIGKTGVVAVIKGKTDTKGRVVGLRADMDALPIEEATGLDYASKYPGKMHACGHDGHTSILLGAAQYLAETRNFDGTVVLAFQPAEEGGGGGREMVNDGLIDRWGIQEVYGLHNMPGLPTGQFAIRPGALLAAADEFKLTVTGKGGHAAAPHQAIDPNVAAAHIILGLQSITSRNVDPLASAVVSVCALHSDIDTHNIIPHVTRMTGTVRALDPDVRDYVEARVKEIATATAQAHQCEVEVEYTVGYPVTINHEAHTEYAAAAARAVAGDVITDIPPIMAAEDFSFMLNACPGAYIMLGNGDGAMVHHPEYQFDDNAIPVGASWFVELVEQRMPAQ
ncbi:amidohydrolase [Tateyamaria omphalii]|uniref:M20 aminoacylase family protein n=1 Tax=Tateyamaria omphalii TaxID=299262 RepID=UPI001C99EBC0|nr:M20 aminoacylase family protein [Tateyamaria omphalii]MBY5932199.1 amidohydrolase [Tateyamaria omphalii]